ncbi:hypothetical protein QAD02_002117, partial [Eretmocerus hayati]
KVCSFTRKVTLHGHQNWIKCIDLMQPNPDNLLIATGSLDSTIRLWRITCLQENSYQSHFDAVGPAKKKFIANDQIYGVILESILNGHEAWVHGVHWHPQITKDDENHQPMKLLSCSLDKSVIIWEPDENTGLWSETLRVGSVGGNSLGLYGCKFSPNGDCILAHSYHGSFYKWRYDEKILKWETTLAPSGHHGYVVDLSWDPRGRFLLTTSADQTTRIHISRHVVEGKEMWHEIGRPQIHGYPMTSLAVLKPNTFASGAEEKVVLLSDNTRIGQRNLEVELWRPRSNFPPNFPALQSSIAGHTVNQLSFESLELNGKMDDVIMKMYLRLICCQAREKIQQNISPFDVHLVLTMIHYGKLRGFVEWANRVKLDEYKIWFLPFNHEEHWTLLIVVPGQKLFIYLDSMQGRIIPSYL